MTKWTDYIRTVPDYPIAGINFYDLNSLFAGPVYRKAMKELKIKTECRFKKREPTYIIGIESRGFVLGSVLAYAMKLPFIMVRKAGAKYPGVLLEESYTLEYGKATIEVHKDSISKDENVLIIDDLIATGGTAEAAAKLIKISGGSVAGFIFVINLFDLPGNKLLKDKGFKTHCLIEFPGH